VRAFPDPRGHLVEHPISFQALHISGPQKIHKLVWVRRTHGVVVNLPEQTCAVSEGNEFLPIDIYPLLVNGRSPLDLLRKILVGEFFQVLMG
jgi:hypothetical protein